MTAAASTNGMTIAAIAAATAGPRLGRKARAELTRGDSPRSGAPVWRNSYYVGQIEDRIWKPIAGGKVREGKRWTGALLKAARAFELRTRAERQEQDPGARNGALGDVGLAVLEYLYNTVDFARGTLEPAIRTIAAEIGRAYSAVHEALVRLRKHGFLQWIRRSAPIEDPEPGGPRVKQASNAYALLVPEGMKSWLARMFGPTPAAACELDRRARDKAELDRMLAGLTATEYQRDFTWAGDRLLGETLRRLAAAVDAREARSANPAGAMKPGDHSDP